MPRWQIYFGLSAAVHAAVAVLLVARPPAKRAAQVPLQLAVVDRPRPPPPPEPLPEPPRAAPPAPAPPPKPRVARSALPPPPTNEAPEPTPQPEISSGVSPESVSAAGSFAVPLGNTLYAPPPERAPEPQQVKPYAAEKYAPAASLSELPRLIAQPDLRRFYPAEARRKEREGAVVLRLWLDASGAVTRAEVISSPGDGLGEAALLAARELRFSPALLQGTPVATSVPFTLHFVLR